MRSISKSDQCGDSLIQLYFRFIPLLIMQSEETIRASEEVASLVSQKLLHNHLCRRFDRFGSMWILSFEGLLLLQSTRLLKGFSIHRIGNDHHTFYVSATQVFFVSKDLIIRHQLHCNYLHLGLFIRHQINLALIIVVATAARFAVNVSSEHG